MRFHSVLSEHESTASAADEAVADVRDRLGDPDVLFVFFTPHHRDEADALVEKLWLELDPQAVVGCSAEGVIGAGKEIEDGPGLSVLAASLPGVRVHPFHVAKDEWRDLLADPDALKERLGAGEQTRAVIAMGDPFSTPAIQLLPMLDQILPGIPVIGGMASAARSPGENVLVRNDGTYDQGMVGVCLSGDALDVQTVVSQGCRPFGKNYVVTKAQQNVIQTLGGKPALQALRDAIMDMPPEDRELLQKGLFVGRAISEYKDKFGRGDFLVRNVMSVDNDSGAVAMGDYVRVGQTVQFHVRDAATATEDLSLMLAQAKSDRPDVPAGGLLFSCNGRGTHLFSEPCHDVYAAGSAMPGTPVAGFFAAGELGPVGNRNFIHGHTASFALFRPSIRR
jgi:small ligand-binding sensory domain FIST